MKSVYLKLVALLKKEYYIGDSSKNKKPNLFI